MKKTKISPYWKFISIWISVFIFITSLVPSYVSEQASINILNYLSVTVCFGFLFLYAASFSTYYFNKSKVEEVIWQEKKSFSEVFLFRSKTTYQALNQAGLKLNEFKMSCLGFILILSIMIFGAIYSEYFFLVPALGILLFYSIDFYIQIKIGGKSD